MKSDIAYSMQPAGITDFSYNSGAALKVYTTDGCADSPSQGSRDGPSDTCPDGNDPDTGNPIYTVAGTGYNDNINAVYICPGTTETR